MRIQGKNSTDLSSIFGGTHRTRLGSDVFNAITKKKSFNQRPDGNTRIQRAKAQSPKERGPGGQLETGNNSNNKK